MENNEQNQQQQQQQQQEQQQQQPRASFLDDNDGDNFGNEQPQNQEQQQQQQQSPEQQQKLQESETKFNSAKTAYEADPMNPELKGAYEAAQQELNSIKNPIVSIFDELPEVAKAEEQLSSQKQLYTNLIKKLNMNVEGDVDEETFIKHVNDHFENAKLKVELDKAKYTPETVEMFDYIESGGDPRDFIAPISSIIDFMALSSKDKVEFVLKNTGKTDQEIKERLDDLTETGKLEEEAGKLMKQAIALRDTTISDVIKKHKDKVASYNETERQRIDRIGSDVIKHLSTMDKFMDEPITDKLRNYVRTEIANGNFSRSFLNNPEALMKGYLFSRFGEAATKKLKDSIVSSSSKSHNAGIEKVKEALHNNTPKEDVSAGARVHQHIPDGKGIGWKDDPDL